MFRKPKQIVDYDLKLKLRGKRLVLTNTTRYLGVTIDHHLSWNSHIENIAAKLRTSNGIIAKMRHYVSQKTLIMIYHALFLSHINYGLHVWGQNLPNNNRLNKLQKIAVRLMTFATHNCRSIPLFRRLNLHTLNETLYIANIKLAYSTLKEDVPTAIQDALKLTYLTTSIITRGNTRGLLRRPEARTTTYGLFSIKYRLVLGWNSLQEYCELNLADLSISKVIAITMEFLSLRS